MDLSESPENSRTDGLIRRERDTERVGQRDTEMMRQKGKQRAGKKTRWGSRHFHLRLRKALSSSSSDTTNQPYGPTDIVPLKDMWLSPQDNDSFTMTRWGQQTAHVLFQGSARNTKVGFGFISFIFAALDTFHQEIILSVTQLIISCRRTLLRSCHLIKSS